MRKFLWCLLLLLFARSLWQSGGGREQRARAPESEAPRRPLTVYFSNLSGRPVILTVHLPELPLDISLRPPQGSQQADFQLPEAYQGKLWLEVQLEGCEPSQSGPYALGKSIQLGPLRASQVERPRAPEALPAPLSRYLLPGRPEGPRSPMQR